MRNIPRNYWEADRLLLIGMHRRGSANRNAQKGKRQGYSISDTEN
jgi:hypothetical protein